MRKFLAYISCLAVMLASVGALLANAAPEESGKQLYADFTAELTADTPAASGNGENTITLYSSYTVTDFVQSGGELSMTFNNGNYVRFANTLPLGELDPNYMVVRMKGTNSWGEGLTGDALTFWFGSWGQQGTKLSMTSEQLTADYSDVVIEIPEGYFDGLSSYDLFIESNRGAEFYVTIDEIYFCDTYPPESSEPEEPEADKYLYTDFTAELTADTPVASGNGENTITLYSGYTVTNFVQSDGELSMTFNNGNYVRFANTLPLGELDPGYMVVRMKGTNSWGEGLTGNALTFWFGSWGQYGADLNMTVEQLTANYSDVVIEIPEGYFDGLTSYDLFIESNRGAVFDITIDEIYFLKDLQTEPSVEKYYYNDFESGLSTEPLPTGNGDNTVYIINVDGASYSCENGVLHMEFTNGNYLRMQNSMTGIENYKYMVVRMKGSYISEDVLTGNALFFWFGSYGTPGANLYMTVEQLTADYSDVVIEIPEGYFDSISDDYKASLFITTECGAVFSIDIEEIYFCNELEGEEHTHSYNAVITEPTCTEQGYTTYVCECGDSYISDYVPATGHDCLYGVCSVCGVRVYMSGDVNEDDTVDIRDLVRLKGIIAGQKNETQTSDINEDSRTDASDLAALTKGLLNGTAVDEEIPLSFESDIKQLGRVGAADAGGKLTLEWSNSGFSFNFTGTSAKITLSASNTEERMSPFIAYSVDGGEFESFRITSDDTATLNIPVVEYGNHSVELVRINEPMNNPIYVLSASVSSAYIGGETQILSPAPAAERQILFIGDSITTGYGNMNTGNHPFDTADQDSTKTYAYLTSEHFGADAQYVCREGRGVVHNGYDCPDLIGDMIGVLSYVNDTEYTPSGSQPDIIVINAGSNDETGGTTASEMEAGAKELLSKLRSWYPDSQILWAYGGVGINSDISSGIIAAISSLNDDAIHYYEFLSNTGSGVYGHPDCTEHEALSAELNAKLSEIMGW